MIPSLLVTDTHPLVWFLAGKHKKLSAPAKAAFEGAVEGECAVWIPTVVLWEMSMLMRAGKIRFRVDLDELVQEDFFGRAFHVLELTAEDVLKAHDLHFSEDPWDTMIVATALRVGCPLITKDSVIQEARPCLLLWD